MLHRRGELTPAEAAELAMYEAEEAEAAIMVPEAESTMAPSLMDAVSTQGYNPSEQLTTTGGKQDVAEIRVRKVLQQLPQLVTLAEMFPIPGHTMTVPVGTGVKGKRYMNIADDTLNIAVYGTSGSGKDTILMGWFVSLVTRNTPEQVKFLVLDGKGHWLTPNLRGLRHMYADPCGGYGEKGTARIEAGLNWIDKEAERRQELIFGQGFRSREEYILGTGEELPLIIVLITDGMDAIQGLIEAMLISLASKGRALGFKVIVSMSTPTKRDMRWRINLSTVFSGPLVDRSQNPVALGLPSDAIVYPPSLLPDPKQRHGVFVVRMGPDQDIVQAPYISDKDFDQIIETLPRRGPNDWVPEEPVPVKSTAVGNAQRVARSASGDNAPEEFADACVVGSEGNVVTGGELYEAYVAWCELGGSEPISNTAFGLAMKEYGLNKVRSGRGVIEYRDIALMAVVAATT